MNRPTRQTEADWLTSTEPGKMLNRLVGQVSDRKLRLFAVACGRHIWDLLRDARSRAAVELAERFAEGAATDAELVDAELAAQDVVDEHTRRHDYPWPIARSNADNPLELAATAAWACVTPDAWVAAHSSVYNASRACLEAAVEPPYLAEVVLLCDLLRDIAGNPFRRVVLESSWVTPTVRAVASTIYEQRGFADLPILADALEEAGCTSADMLGHCRSGGKHVCGCWVVDLVLARS